MKLAVSNVAWYPGRIDEFLRLLVSVGCRGVELAASMLWEEPVRSSGGERSGLRRRINDSGLSLSGLQALLYSRPDLTLFGADRGRRDTLEYLAGMMDLCAELGGEVLVFGSPGNRNVRGRTPEEANRIAMEFFREVAAAAAARGVTFCIEPLGRTETDFINRVSEAEGLIEALGSPEGLGLHIDVKGLIEEGEVGAPYLTRSFSRARHVHVNDPGLLPPGSTGYDHSAVRDRMAGSGYSRFLSIEMRRQDADPEAAIRRAADYVKRVYLGEP